MWNAVCLRGAGWLRSFLKVGVSHPSTAVFWAGQLAVGAVMWTVGCWAHPCCLSHLSHNDQECPRHCQVFPWGNTTPYFPLPHLRTTAGGWAVWAFSLGNLVLPLALVMFPRKESSTLLPEMVLLGSAVLALCVRYVQLGPVVFPPREPSVLHFPGNKYLCLLSGLGRAFIMIENGIWGVTALQADYQPTPCSWLCFQPTFRTHCASSHTFKGFCWAEQGAL